jgi:small subunit ribosomal protein S17
MKVFIGKVVSTKMDKTATVTVESVVAHPVYKKRFKRVKKYHLHDEFGVEVGDLVKFSASKPFSKLKKWKIIEVVRSEKGTRKGSGVSRGSKRSKSSKKEKQKPRKKLVAKKKS